jgi:hypothetical protein
VLAVVIAAALLIVAAVAMRGEGSNAFARMFSALHGGRGGH